MPHVGAVLVHRLDVRVGRVEVRHAPIAEAIRHARWVHRSAPGMFGRGLRLSMSECVERAVVDLPDVAAERAARQLVLRPVVVAAPAAEDLEPSVAADVVGRRRGAARACPCIAEVERDSDARPGTTGTFSCSVRRPRFSVSAVVDLPRSPARRARRCSRPPVPTVPTVVDRVVAVRAAAWHAVRRCSVNVRPAVPEDVDVPARVGRVHVVERVLEAVAALQPVSTSRIERVVVVERRRSRASSSCRSP